MLSVIIPARNEKYLEQTINSLFDAAEGKIEVIVVLDGYWPDNPIPDRPNLSLVHRTESIGMRPAINSAAQLAKGKYLMKCDAHCLFDKGFDTKLITDCEPDWTVVPRRYALDTDKWERDKQKCDYQYIRQEDFKGRDWKEHIDKEDIQDLMTFQGSCWFMHRQRFFDLECLDDINYGHMGKEAQEICLKSWLSGGRVVVNKKTWYAHLDKKERGYSLSQETKDKSRQFAIDCWTNNNWPKQTKGLRWLINKFNPPTWENWQGRYVTEEALSPSPSPGQTQDTIEKVKSLSPQNTIDQKDISKENTMPETIDYDKTGKRQLRKIGKERGISVSGLQRSDIIKALRKADGTAEEEIPLIIPDLRKYFIEKKQITRIDLAPIRVRGFTRKGDLYQLFNTLGLRKGAEVGTKAGVNAERMCKAILGIELTVVDPWIDYNDDRRHQVADLHENFYQDTCRRLAPFNAKAVRAMSMDAVRDVPIGSLDFVYIDGNHSFDYTMEDLIAWSRRVRTGGIVSGHDYYRFKKGGVLEAVDAYAKNHGIGALFICDEKTPSFFWRKP